MPTNTGPNTAVDTIGQVLQIVTEMRGEVSSLIAESRLRHASSDAAHLIQTADIRALDSRLRAVEMSNAGNSAEQRTRWGTWGPVAAFLASAALAVALLFLKR